MRASDDSAHFNRDSEGKKSSGFFASIARGFKSLSRSSAHSGRASDNAQALYRAEDNPPNNDNVHFRHRESSTQVRSVAVTELGSVELGSSSPVFQSEASLASDSASSSQLIGTTPVRHKSSVIAHRAAVMRARTLSADTVSVDEVEVTARIEVGQVVTVTSDEHALQRAIVAAGMMWPRGPSGGLWTRKLGISGTIAEVDMSDGTVALSGDHGWIPINALAGFELWQRESSSSTQPAACSNEISPAAASTGTPLSSPQSAVGDAAPSRSSRSSRKGRYVTNISESSEEAQPHVDPEVTPEARVSDPVCAPVTDRGDERTNARKKSKIKRSVCRTSNGSLGSRARHSGRSCTSQGIESPASRLRTRGSFFDDLDDLTSEQENEQASCQATSCASGGSAGSSSPPNSLTDAVQDTGLRRLSGLSLLADNEPVGTTAQVTQQPRPLSGESLAARLTESRSDALRDLPVQNSPSLMSEASGEVTSNGPAEALHDAADAQGSENGQQTSQAVAVEEVSKNATRQPKARRSKQRLSQSSNSPVDSSGDLASESLEKTKRQSQSMGDGKASPPKQRTSRVKRSSRPLRSGSLASGGSQTFLEDDLLVPAMDPSKQQEADDIERMHSMLDLLLNESSDDDMAGDICVTETRPTPTEDATDELQGKTSDSKQSAEPIDSRCSIFSSITDNSETVQASPREGAPPAASGLLDVPKVRLSRNSQNPEASTTSYSMFKRFSLASLRGSARCSQISSNLKSRHINWRDSRVGSLCESNLLDEAMAKVAVGEQAMHPERAKSGFSLFKRMKTLLEAQDFDDTPGQKVIENIFFDSIPKKFVEICSIEQVLRIDLLKRFLKKVSDESGSIEATFHGTREEYVKDILDVGLCPNLCATGAYGRGAYVGTHAGVAHQYADPNAEGTRHMCVVLTVVGQKVVKGKEGEQCPATATDSLANPTQYCFVDEDRLYISHLITYRVVNTTTRRTGGGWDDPFQRRLTTAVSRAAKMRNKGGRR